MFHIIKNVHPLPDMQLFIEFASGLCKRYDVKPLLEKWEAFRSLSAVTGLFNTVRVDVGGYGISWNDELDLSCEELWENGMTEDTHVD